MTERSEVIDRRGAGTAERDAVRAAVSAAGDRLVDLSHRIHGHPELAFEETRAAAWTAGELADAGFEVTTGVGGLATAFIASTGPGPLHVAFCAEYDALPGMGHACGHNVIAAAAVGAALGLAPVADLLGLRVSVVGTPAEESGGGKITLLEQGVFAGVHAAMMVHPAPVDVVELPVTALAQLDARYTGRAAHAAACPELGVNAADALTVAQVAIGLIRQQLRPGDAIHGIVTDGGAAPNIIPERTSATYQIRARTLADLAAVRERVGRCLAAGAIATGCTLRVEPRFPAYAELRHDPDLSRFYRQSATALGRTFPVLPADPRGAASTDMGNVSQAMPAIHPSIGVPCADAANHQPGYAAACATPAADRAVLDGATAMAWTAVEAARTPAVRTRLLHHAKEAS